jgi:23S rRNA U2552 (ribose-2'-O)-methylase RlmE/FtsJ
MASYPSIKYSELHNTFVNFQDLLTSYQRQVKIILQPTTYTFQPVSSDTPPSPVNKEEEDLLQLQDLFALASYATVRNALDVNVSNWFLNRAGVKLSNIDALFNLSKHNLITPYDLTPMRYVDLGAAPGAWTQYMQYRYKNSYGYLVSYEDDDNKALKYDLRAINEEQYTILGTGYNNLLNDAEQIVQYILQREQLDAVIADAAPGVESEQEWHQQRFLLAELIIALQVSKVGAYAVFKFFGGLQQTTQDLCYLAACCYKNSYIVKPASSRDVNNELYLVCIDKLEDNKTIVENLLAVYRSRDNYSKLLSNNNSNIKQLCEYYLQEQLHATAHTVGYLQDPSQIIIDKTRDAKLTTAWVIPYKK